MSRSWRIAIFASIGLHMVAGTILFGSINWKRPAQPRLTAQNQPTVKAEAVDIKSVEKEIKRIEDAENQKRRQEADRLKKIQDDAARAQRARQEEQNQLAKLKKEQDALKKQTQAKLDEQKKAHAEIEKIKQRQQDEREKLAKLAEQQKKAAEAVKRAEEKAKREAVIAEKKRQAEQAEFKQAQLAHERREKLRHVSELDRFRAMISEAIRMYWVVPDDLDPNLMCQLLVRLAPGGDVLEVSLLKSSGNDVLDRSARTAVIKASPLPVPDNAVLFDNFRELRLTVRPGSVDSFN